jgi:hypothetical protein
VDAVDFAAAEVVEVEDRGKGSVGGARVESQIGIAELEGLAVLPLR